MPNGTRDIDQATIFAVASGAGRAAIAVVRISGAASHAVLAALCRHVPAPRQLALRRLRSSDGALLDQAMVVWLPGPGSYTGEDSAELHVHGGRAVLEGVSEALVTLGARPAEPGEFSRRAFLNGRMDLTEAEAVHDLVAAETAAQRQQALRQLDGGLGALYRVWAERLRRLVAQQDALIDFPDEDLPEAVEAAALAELARVAAEIAAHVDDGRCGERLRDGLVFAVVGPPNVGKSSLINLLAERDVAIVNGMPGTTRDVLEAHVVLGGVPVTLVDTAGLRPPADPIEAEGVRRARARAADADLVVVVSEVGGAAANIVVDGPTLLVANKLDLGGAVSPDVIAVSALTGEGLVSFRQRLAEIAQVLARTSGPPPLTRARHRAALLEARVCLDEAQAASLPELRAECLCMAMQALGRITGQVGVEDILDSIFSEFCIGK